jgi:hypothetical protein
MILLRRFILWPLYKIMQLIPLVYIIWCLPRYFLILPFGHLWTIFTWPRIFHLSWLLSQQEIHFTLKLCTDAYGSTCTRVHTEISQTTTYIYHVRSSLLSRSLQRWPIPMHFLSWATIFSIIAPDNENLMLYLCINTVLMFFLLPKQMSGCSRTGSQVPKLRCFSLGDPSLM